MHSEHSIRRKPHLAARLLLIPTFLLACAVPAFPATQEKDGVRLDLTIKTLSRDDGPQDFYWKDINRVLAVKVTLKNTGFHPLAEGNLSYTLLVRRWGMGESGNIERIEGSEAIEALERSQVSEKQLGEFQIGGHLHGASKHHLDSFEEWQVKIEFGDKVVVFESSSKFERLNKLAGKNY